MNDIFDQISKKYGIPKFLVKEIWESQFRFVTEKMRAIDHEDINSYKTFYIRNLGKFYANKKKIQFINKYKKEKENGTTNME